MTIRYCDFCGEVIPEGEGDPVTLADVNYLPEAAKDACDTCVNILWQFTKDKSLATSVSPDSGSLMREKWRVGSKVSLNIYEGDRPVCQCHTALDAQRIVSAINRQLQLWLSLGEFRCLRRGCINA